MKIAVYTAIFGNFDVLKKQPEQDIDCDFFCFTDCDITDSDWNVVTTDFSGDTPRFRAKFPKTKPHIVLPDYDITYWIDGSVQLKDSSSVRLLIERMGCNDNLFFVHPDRNCIYDELEVSMKMDKYKGHGLREQVKRYEDEGYPRHNGLMACTTILRKNSKNNRVMGNLWYDEMSDDLIQDQLSLPYVVWKNNLKINIDNINLYNNEYIIWGGHKDGRTD